MSAIADTITILASNIVLTAGIATRLSSDLVTDRDRLTPGVTYYSIAWAYNGRETRQDSNIVYHGYVITIWIRFRLVNPLSEVEFLGGANLAEIMLRVLGNRAFWKSNTGMSAPNPDVYDMQLGDDALVLSAPEREGNIISFSAVAKIVLKP